MTTIDSRSQQPMSRHLYGIAKAGESRQGDLANLPSLAVGAIALYALHAWVIQVDGETPIGRRASLLALIGTALGLAWLVSRLSERARSISMLLVGVIGLSVMAPVVGSHVVKLGFEGSRITGIIAIVGAAFLVTVGSARLLRAARTLPRKLLALLVAFVLLQFIVIPLGSAAYTTQAAHPRLGTRTPADLGLAYEDVSFPSGDGTMLAGWYIPSSNGAAVLVRHGSGSTRTATLEHAAFMAGSGYGVLLTDARGHGGSGAGSTSWDGTALRTSQPPSTISNPAPTSPKRSACWACPWEERRDSTPPPQTGASPRWSPRERGSATTTIP